MNALTIKNLSVSFGKNSSVLQDFSLSLKKGEILILLGSSGCGKSTILRSIAGLQKVQSGSIHLGEKVVNDETTFIPPQKRNIGFVFQDYALFPHLSVADNILFANKNAQLTELLEMCKIDALKNRYPHELSGGQQQRVALARALALEPEILLLDEPFSSIDMFLKKSLQQELLAIIKDTGISSIIVTHDKQEALILADSMAVLNDGNIEQIGTPQELYTQPKNSFIARFIGEYNIIPKRHTHHFLPNSEGDLAMGKEHIFISDEGLEARVVAQIFLGDSYELTLDFNGIELRVKHHTLIDEKRIHFAFDKERLIPLLS